MKWVFFIVASVLFFTVRATAQTNTLTDAEVQGQLLAQKILQQTPAENFTNFGVLKVHNPKGVSTNYLIQFSVRLEETNWSAAYQTVSNFPGTCLIVNHVANRAMYLLVQNITGAFDPPAQFLNGPAAAAPFLGSDFNINDLGLEFLRWPQQKVLKREVHSSRGCTVLESTNPHPTPETYSRVVAWIDTETLGIVEAYAYDAKGRQLKDFYPKDYTKVDGQWQVQTLIMVNVQTRSRSRLEFDLKK